MNIRSIRRRSNRQPYAASVDSTCDLAGDLRNVVGQRLVREFRDRLPMPLIRRALDEAAETACATEFPDLFFPLLAEERVRLTSRAAAEPLDHPAYHPTA